VKLLLDEMLPAAIAEQLRRRGHDAIAVCERPELRGLPDSAVLGVADGDERAIVTYNRDDFLALDRQYRSQGREHHGIVILNPRRFPEGVQTIGRLVTALDAFIAAGPPYPAFVSWLQ
jgi:hypothetical protein